MKRYVSALLLVLMLMQIPAVLCGCEKAEPSSQSTDLTMTQAATAEALDVPATTASAAQTTEAPLEENVYWEDYQQFWEYLERDYPYLPWLADHGIDLDALRAKYEAQLDQVQDTMAFLNLLQSLCDDLGNLGHLWPLSPERYQSVYEAYCEDPELSDWPEFQAYRDALSDPGLSPIYQHVSQTVEQQIESQSIPEVQVTYYPDCKALCLTIDSFKNPVIKRDQAVLTDALREYPDVEHIIFDITNNGGGNEIYWEDNLVRPLGGNPYAMGGRKFYRNTPFLSQYYSPNNSVPVAVLENVPDWVSEMKLDRCMYWDGWEPQTTDTETETIPGANAKLDRTGLLFQFTGEAGENPVTGMPSACQGTIPDYEADDPLEACLELIRSAS